MAYVKNIWVDQAGQVRYTETEDDGYKIFTANYEEVTELGTPVNATNMNHIENGIEDCDTAISGLQTQITNLLTKIDPIGRPIFTLDFNNLPTNCIWLEGAKVLKSNYANLVSVYGNDYAPADAEDTDTYLYLPNIKGRVIWGADDAGYISAGLPNITGQATLCAWPYTGASNAFKDTNYNGAAWRQGGSGDGHAPLVYPNVQLNLNASNSNSIYGASPTVQPPSIKVRFYTRYQ